MGEGDTPLIELPTLAAKWGLSALFAKAEYLNPTGSYKDRIACESMRVATDRGARGWLGTSSGNGGAAMSAYGARANLPGVLCVLSDAPTEKLGSIAPYGILMLSMPTITPTTMEELAALAEHESLFLTITAHTLNPEGMRGADAIGREIGATAVVTHVYVPTGGGGLLTSTGRGLSETSSNARLVAAQPSGCAPIANFLNGEITQPAQSHWHTSISGLQLPEPPDGNLAATEVRARDGWGVGVPDQLAWDIQSELAELEGIFVEPASALALAAIALDARSGRLGAHDAPCVVLTGHGLKDLSRFTTKQFRPVPTDPSDVPNRTRSWLAAARTTPQTKGDQL